MRRSAAEIRRALDLSPTPAHPRNGSPMFASTVAALLMLLAAPYAEVASPPAPTAPTPTAADQEVTFAFWNLENLFDTEDDPKNPGDDEFLPAEGWDDERYGRKLAHLASVVAALDAHLLGVCEVENRRVLEDLIARNELSGHGYSIAHLDTPDKRGIDMGVLFRAPFELAEGDRAVQLHPIDLGDVPRTRGILEVDLTVHGQPLVVLVNHWPSRGGGERTVEHRQRAAETARRVVLARLDAARLEGREADILIIGDFNDDPFDDSLVEHLEAVRGKFALRGDRGRTVLHNPSWTFLGTPDLGTLYYRSGWNVFDQAIVSRGMLDADGLHYVEGSLAIHEPDRIRNLNHPGHPPRWFREYRGNWDEGYSDHFAIVGRLGVPTAAGETDQD